MVSPVRSPCPASMPSVSTAVTSAFSETDPASALYMTFWAWADVALTTMSPVFDTMTLLPVASTAASSVTSPVATTATF